MTGATPDLDAMVQDAAIALRDLFGRDVEIRFNANRMSGGAFLKGEEEGRKLGVCVRLEPEEEWPDGMDFREWKRIYDDAPKFPRVYVNVGTARLVDKSLATRGSSLRPPYAYLPQGAWRRLYRGCGSTPCASKATLRRGATDEVPLAVKKGACLMLHA